MAITLGDLAKYNAVVARLIEMLGNDDIGDTEVFALRLRAIANNADAIKELQALIHELKWRGRDMMHTVIVPDAVSPAK